MLGPIAFENSFIVTRDSPSLMGTRSCQGRFGLRTRMLCRCPIALGFHAVSYMDFIASGHASFLSSMGCIAAPSVFHSNSFVQVIRCQHAMEPPESLLGCEYCCLCAPVRLWFVFVFCWSAITCTNEFEKNIRAAMQTMLERNEP